MQQVFAEHVLPDPILERLVRRGDHANVNAHRNLATDAIELTLREHAQQTGLQLRRHIADLIEEQCAAIGLFETTAAQGICAGERALFVAEQFGLQQIGSECRCVQRNEGFVRTRTVTMQSSRDELFARARFARDQHRHARTRKATDGTEHFLHRRRLTEHFRDAARFRADFLDPFFLLGRAPHEVDRLIDIERLRQVLECTALIRRDCAVEVRVRRHHDHW